MKFVKPAPGLIVRYPGNPKQTLSIDGEFVELNTEWKRLIRSGDVVIDEGKTLANNKPTVKKDLSEDNKL